MAPLIDPPLAGDLHKVIAGIVGAMKLPPAIPAWLWVPILAAGSAAAQSGDPVGGWYKPLLRAEQAPFLNAVESIGDVTGDGVRDLLCKYPAYGYVKVFDGASGVEWYESSHISFSGSHADTIDLDQDGVADLLLRSPAYSSATHHKCGRLDAIQGGTGLPLWTYVGNLVDLKIGDHVKLVDLNGDGIADVLNEEFRRPITAVDGATGQMIWQHDPQAEYGLHLAPDVQGDGVPDLYLVTPNWLTCLDGSNATPIWSTANAFATFSYGIFLDPELYQADLNGDGFPDPVLGDGTQTSAGGIDHAGTMMAMNGLTGDILWLLDGSGEQHSLGRTVEMSDVNGDGVIDFYSVGTGGVELVDGSSGTAFWSTTLPTTEYADNTIAVRGDSGQRIWTKTSAGNMEWHALDFNADGQNELVEITAGLPTKVSILNPTAGDATLQFKLQRTDVEIIGVHDDLDQDGELDLILRRGFSDPISVEIYSSRADSYTTGLELSQSTLSQSAGGHLDLDFEVSKDFAGHDHHLLLSETGTGPSQVFGVSVPLSAGALLTRSTNAAFPPSIFTNATGTLDADAHATIQIQVAPNQLPTSAIGLQIHLAAVVMNPFGSWGLMSSGSESFTIGI